FEVGIFDLRLPDMTGLDVLRRLRQASCEMEVILLTAEGTIESAVEAMKLGAYDYLTKPCRLAELEQRCRKAVEAGRLRRENRQLRELVERARPQTEMIGKSPAMQELFRLIERAAPTETPILIQGESGTGKELVARALQRQSRRAEQPFVVINCAALPEQLLESELFGHEKGAFTGAVAAKPGLFEIADNGTLLIDEVGELAPSLQAKLLRVLEDGSFRRVGSLKESRVNVRLLAATNRNLADEVQAGRFREDLYYRINVLSLYLPPLRQRAGDLPLLIESFLGPNWEVEHEAVRALESYQWPGNVRQLLNALERARILADDRIIRLHNLPPEVIEAGRATGSSPVSAASDELDVAMKAHVYQILDREQGNKARAARVLGVSRRSLYRLLDRYESDGDSLLTPKAEPPPAATRPVAR
ncbi:MAG: sigma-54-dependent Fis family transcriptional regulator, partial [Planctomycetaceae bacterium]|nr:sigma-54-dependent Fis family transcriptional regulator [Planctomycetaceae bacterium]